ncbi:hypothetical protein GYB57_09750 [bacterium]|nr:hypothetical protein [bacterium]
METDKLKKQNRIDLEPFYQALEDDRKLLEEAFVILLEMVNNEPESVKNLAKLIKDDYRNLYDEIADLNESKQENGNSASCCS